jgi:hypothetical protein
VLAVMHAAAPSGVASRRRHLPRAFGTEEDATPFACCLPSAVLSVKSRPT